LANPVRNGEPLSSFTPLTTHRRGKF